MHEDIKWIFGLLLVFGAIWFVSGGLNEPSSRDPFIKPLPPVGTGETYGRGVSHIGRNSSAGSTGYYTYSSGGASYPVYSPAPSGGSQRQPGTPEEIAAMLRDVGVEAERIKQEIAKLEEEKHGSPLKGKLSIGGVAAGGDPRSESIAIRVSDGSAGKTLITGLRLQSVPSGRGANIPKAAYILFQNQVNTEEPLYLSPGETAYIITGRSPIGVSFRGNKCGGFLNQFQNLGLAWRCPSPASELLPVPANIRSDACIDYIESLPSCQIVTTYPPGAPPECVSYAMREISYAKCVDRHKAEADFYDKEWRVYLGRDETLWKNRRELIQLLDQNGKVIDSVTY